MRTLCCMVCVVLAVLPAPSCPHPQCLDFQPPFQASGLLHCPQYEPFGCCEVDRDAAAGEAMAEVLFNSSQAERQLCEPHLNAVACLACSPYAAHIYETEGGEEARVFPQLCGDYCRLAYQECREPLRRLLGLEPLEVPDEPPSQEELADEARAFCEQRVPDDSAYCYPRVLDGPTIEGFSTEQVGELGCVCAQPVANQLRNPLAAVSAGDGSGRLFIAEQVGVVHVLDRDNNLLPQPFLDITDSVLTSSRRGDERGFLGLTFHPKHADNGLFYVYYSTTSGGAHYSTVSEFRVNSSNSNVANLTSERVLLSLNQPRSNHNGGQLLFLDGYLLVFLGDGGGGGDVLRNGLNLGTLLGSVLRIDVDHQDPGKEYAIPSDNPFVNDSSAQPEIYAYGLRNPWRCSVDRGDRSTGEGAGTIFCGDVGQNEFEEVDIIVKGGNYGWRAFEGNSCYASSLCDSETVSEAIPPIHTYPHSVGVSITGGYVYRGCMFPNLQGLYIFGDYGSGKIFALKEENMTGEWQSQELCMGDDSVCTGSLVGQDRLKHILSFGEDEEGELYILATSYASPTAENGVVYRLVDPARRAAPMDCMVGVLASSSSVVPTREYSSAVTVRINTRRPPSTPAQSNQLSLNISPTVLYLSSSTLSSSDDVIMTSYDVIITSEGNPSITPTNKQPPIIVRETEMYGEEISMRPTVSSVSGVMLTPVNTVDFSVTSTRSAAQMSHVGVQVFFTSLFTILISVIFNC